MRIPVNDSHETKLTRVVHLNRREFLAGVGAAALCATNASLADGATDSTPLDFQKLLLPVPRQAKLEMPGYYVWGGSMTRDAAGRCHLLFARWPSTTGGRGWVSHSDVGLAVADQPLGPYRFQGVALAGRGGEAWDACMIHNPTVLTANSKYYLYYTGSRGPNADQNAPLSDDDYWIHRNNQRIGVAVADHPSGPWRRFDKPLLDVSSAGWDTLITTNPSVCPTPDGGCLMVYKTASPGKRPAGRVVHGVACADSPLGPFRKHPEPIFTHDTAAFPAEDPTVWQGDDRYYAIVKDMGGHFTDAGRSLVLFESRNGVDWKLSEHPLVSKLEIHWRDGDIQTVHRLERPQLYRENGKPTVLFCAAHPGRREKTAFNVHIPLGNPGAER